MTQQKEPTTTKNKRNIGFSESPDKTKITKEELLARKEMKIKATSREFPNSAFATYFGKPPFHAYGQGNVNPPCAAQKLLSHNINCATNKQNAEFVQVYDSALQKGINKLEPTNGKRIPFIPKKKKRPATAVKSTG